LDQLGIPRKDGSPAEQNHRRIWQIFCENFYLFRGTPTGLWLTDEMINVFGITIKPDGDNAQRIYDMLSERLASPEYKPRSLFSRFNIQVLCTTDPASSNLAWHRSLYNDGWAGKIRPTFRPDAVTNLLASGWRKSIDDLSSVSRIDINRYSTFIHALEQRRVFFRENGAVASDHSAIQPMTINLPEHHVEAIFQRALKGEADFNDAALFTGHMLVEMARMSVEDGLVMQLHAGPFRNHNALIYGQFGLDKGADIPVACDFTRGLAPLLDLFGNDSRLTLILFSLDESAYSRELAPLAGHYPILKLGPPWWFHDSFNGMRRYLDQVVETAGLYNLAKKTYRL
jgi:glucuronate isomerase